jgi:glutaredoxin
MSSTPSIKVVVYGRETCKLCLAAKDKLKLMNILFKSKEIDPLIALHSGWRKDESIDLMVAYQMGEHLLPVISVDGQFFSYPLAMAHLKNLKRAQAPVKENVLVPA